MLLARYLEDKKIELLYQKIESFTNIQLKTMPQ